MKIPEMTSVDEVLAGQLKNPDFREEWDRTALAREVSNRIVAYRAEHGLSQAALARRLEVSQPLIARLETGEHEPTLSTLARLARQLDLEFHIDITPTSLELTA